MHNLKQFHQAIVMYEINHGDYPDTLMDLFANNRSMQMLMENPKTGARNGYIYHKPKQGGHPDKTPMMYELVNGKPDPKGNILYASGRIKQDEN